MTLWLNYGLVALLFVAWVGLFTVKDAARDAGREVDRLEREITHEEARIDALMTDWAILNEPSYLQDLAQMHLGLQATDARQIVTMSALPPVPLEDREDPGAGGTFFASARGYQQLPSAAAAPRSRPYTDWVSPEIRPSRGR